MTLDIQRGTMRQWTVGHDGVKRWADNNKPVLEGPDCDRSACGDFSPGECDHPDCESRVSHQDKMPPAKTTHTG